MATLDKWVVAGGDRCTQISAVGTRTRVSTMKPMPCCCFSASDAAAMLPVKQQHGIDFIFAAAAAACDVNCDAAQAAPMPQRLRRLPTAAPQRGTLTPSPGT